MSTPAPAQAFLYYCVVIIVFISFCQLLLPRQNLFLDLRWSNGNIKILYLLKIISKVREFFCAALLITVRFRHFDNHKTALLGVCLLLLDAATK